VATTDLSPVRQPVDGTVQQLVIARAVTGLRVE